MAEYVRNAWYPAAWSRDVKRELISRRILEERPMRLGIDAAPTRMRQMVENRIKAEAASARASDASAAGVILMMSNTLGRHGPIGGNISSSLPGLTLGFTRLEGALL